MNRLRSGYDPAIDVDVSTQPHLQRRKGTFILVLTFRFNARAGYLRHVTYDETADAVG